jgi:signal transduction histidine kinase
MAFQPFERLERASGTTFGAGMGLSIARIKAEAMGGSIFMRNLAEGGAEAIITLPIPEEAETTAAHGDSVTP